MTTILITGAARGIGFEMARQAAVKGWNVVGSVRSVEDQRELAGHIPQMAVLNFDVTNKQAIDKVAHAFHRPVDVLVNNAGIYGARNQTVTDTDTEAMQDLFDVNVVSPLRVVQAFLPFVKASENPRIVNISSRLGASWASSAGKIMYSASKAAVSKLTLAMAEELADDRIACVAMHPGWVRTDMGGSSADVSPVESAAGILEIIEKLTFEDNGTFINYDGERWEW